MKNIIKLFYDSAVDLSRDYGGVHSAALGYYILLSIFPLATLIAIIVTRIIGPSAFAGNYEQLLSNFIGLQYSGIFQKLIADGYQIASNNVWTLVNILVLIYAASYMFYQARVSLDAMWHLSPKPGVANSLLATVKTYALAYVIALLVGLSFLALLFLNTLWNVMSNVLAVRFSLNLAEIIPILNLFSSPLIYSLIFLVAFRYLPQANTRWVDLIPGAILTAVLYWLGNYLYAIYLSSSSASTFYGIASSMVLFLFWVYYSAMIFLYGAKFTFLYVTRYGRGVVPHSNMSVLA